MQTKNKQPLISLCIVTKNNAGHLPLTLNSVHKFVDEIIVVDLGSVDGTQRIAREFDAFVINHSGKEDLSAARSTALSHARGKWILQLDPGHELVVNEIQNVRKKLLSSSSIGYFIPEYSHDNPADYYYQPLLYKNLPDLTFNQIFDESPIFSLRINEDFNHHQNELRILKNVHLFYRVKELQSAKALRNIEGIQNALKKDPQNISLYFHIAFFYKMLNYHKEFQDAVQKGIQIMTKNELDKMLKTRESTGLFGYFAESLVRQNMIVEKTINSLNELQQTLPSDIRLNKSLAVLLHKIGRTEEALNLLQEAIQLSFKPDWTTISFYESYVEPVYQLLEIIRQTRNEDDMLKVVLNIQNITDNNGFSIKPVFSFLNEYHPDFLNMIDGILKRNLKVRN